MTEQTRDPDAIIARYADGPAQLEAAIAGLTEEELDLAQTADTWTIRQIVHHVVDGDDIWVCASRTTTASKLPWATAAARSPCSGIGTSHRMSGWRVGTMQGETSIHHWPSFTPIVATFSNC